MSENATHFIQYNPEQVCNNIEGLVRKFYTPKTSHPNVIVEKQRHRGKTTNSKEEKSNEIPWDPSSRLDLLRLKTLRNADICLRDLIRILCLVGKVNDEITSNP